MDESFEEDSVTASIVDNAERRASHRKLAAQELIDKKNGSDFRFTWKYCDPPTNRRVFSTPYTVIAIAEEGGARS